MRGGQVRTNLFRLLSQPSRLNKSLSHNLSRGANMPRFTDQQEITYLEIHENIYLLTNHGTNGQLTIESFDGDDWVLTDTVTTTGGQRVFVKGQTIRFTPSNGMVYTVPRGR